MSAVIQPKAQDRLYELIEREQLPGDVRETLAGALTGDLPRQQLLFQAMIDTWPRLQKNLTEVARSVSSTPWEIQPYSEQGNEATDSAIEKARMVQTAIENMAPRPAWDELSERGLVKSLVHGYYMGHQVCEVFWDRKPEGTMPRSAKIVPPRFYDYPDTGEDRLMFSPDGGFYTGNYEDFPEHHFVIAVNRGHGAHPSIAAPLRALTGYWLAATFGLKWLLQFAQLYGVPFRWAEYEDETVKSKVCNMLENIGSAGWGAFPKGTKLDFVNAGQSADSLPQAMLLEMADKQCDTFILGQTLTTDVGNSGSRALGDIHQEVRAGVMQGINDFIGDIYNHQLIPSIIKLNYGSADELPKYSSKIEAPKDEIGMAQRDQTLISMGMEVGKEWLYERHGVPMPEEGDDDIFSPGGNGAGGDPQTGNSVLSPNETLSEADPDNNDEEVEASMVRAYDPNQKRADKGSDNGGQWVKDGDNKNIPKIGNNYGAAFSPSEFLDSHLGKQLKKTSNNLVMRQQLSSYGFLSSREFADEIIRLMSEDDFNIKAAYDPNQKRAEKGSDNGGQWVADNSKGDGEKKSRVSEAESKRYSELEAKFNEGTITDEELGEAHDLVEKAAKAAGYDVEAYHYTNAEIGDAFSIETSRTQSDVQGVFFMDRPDPYREYGGNEHRVFLNTGNPTDYDTAYKDWKGDRYDSGIKRRELLQKKGFDSVIIPPEESGMEYSEIIIFNPSQIKSADIFTGTPLAERFDDKDDRITFSHAVQAYDPNQKRGEKGSPDGGRWVKEDGTSSSDEASDADYLAAVEAGDTEAAQAMVDEAAKRAGYDVRAFHGTNSRENFDVFRINGSESQGSYLESDQEAYFFADVKTAGEFENSNIPLMDSYLKLESPYIIDVDHEVNELSYGSSLSELEQQGYPIKRWMGEADESFESSRSAVTYFDDHAQEFFERAKENGSDGIIVEGADDSIMSIVFSPNQIKSADAVTYDSDGKVVPLSKRFDDKDDRITFSHAVKAAEAKKATIDQLSDNVLESLTGVTREWLSPVRPHFEKLAAMAMSKQVSDADFIEALEKSQREMPELFDKLNVEALQASMEDAIGTAMIVGSVERYEADEVKAYDPNQKRGEAGTPQGGRWVKDDGAKSQKEKTIERFGDEASSMMRKLKENEGFTLNLDGTDELSGYAVSIDKSSERVFDELTEENLEDYIREFWDDLNLEGRHLGGWYNKADNKIYLDVPIIVDDFDTATRLASENDQIAFFHLDTFTEYQTDEAIRQIKERQ